MPLLDELLVGLGFEYDPTEVQQFNKDVDKSLGIIKDLVKIAVAGAAAITSLTIASTKATDEQGKLATEIGDTVENIDALQFALKRAGGTSDGMSSSLRNLAIRASEAARGVGSGVAAFGLLGISTTDLKGELKPTSDLLLEVSQRFQGLAKGKQIELADKLGLRDSILLLQQGPKAIRELIGEAEALGVTTGEDAAIAEEFQDSLTDIWQITKQLSRTLSKTFTPILKELNSQFTDWWKMNKSIIEQNLPKWIDDITSALKQMVIIVGIFLAFRLASHLFALINLFKGLSIAMLAANIAAFLLPGLILAGVVALAALVEDAKVFFEGGESFIGDMIKKFPEWKNEINVIAGVLDTVATLTSLIFEGWSNIFDLFKTDTTFDDFKEVLNNISKFALLGASFGLYGGDGKSPIPELGQSISNKASTFIDKMEIVVQGGADTADNIANAVFNVFQQTSQDLNTVVEQ